METDKSSDSTPQVTGDLEHNVRLVSLSGQFLWALFPTWKLGQKELKENASLPRSCNNNNTRNKGERKVRRTFFHPRVRVPVLARLLEHIIY